MSEWFVGTRVSEPSDSFMCHVHAPQIVVGTTSLEERSGVKWGQMRLMSSPDIPPSTHSSWGGWGAPGKFPGAAFVMLREESRLSFSFYLCSLGEGQGPCCTSPGSSVYPGTLPPLPLPRHPCMLPERTVALGSLGCSQPWDFTCLREMIPEFTSPLWRRVGGATQSILPPPLRAYTVEPWSLEETHQAEVVRL